MFCIDFENGDLISHTAGEYRPWVLNNGVTIVHDPQCPQGQWCGFFNASCLEVPFFSNNYDHWPSLRITLSYKMTQPTQMDQGIVSNDCFQGLANAPGNSLYLSASSTDFKAGLKAGNPVIPDASAQYVSSNCICILYDQRLVELSISVLCVFRATQFGIRLVNA